MGQLRPFIAYYQSLDSKDQRDYLSLILALITLTVYLPASVFDFIGYDDPVYILQNPNVRSGITLASFQWAFTTLHGDVAYWHPLTWISHQIDWALYGRNAGGHHVTSAILHAINTVLVFQIARWLTKNLLLGAVIALFFGIHPLRIESVAWISERKDVLCALFYFLAILSHIKFWSNPSGSGYIRTFLIYCCSLMSKPMGVTLPCALILIDLLILKTDNESSRRLTSRIPKSLSGSLSSFSKLIPYFGRINTAPKYPFQYTYIVLEKLPYFVTAAFVSILTFKAQQELKAIISYENLPLYERLANAIVSYATYVWMTFFPINQSVRYSHPFFQHIALFFVSTVAISLISGWVVRKRNQSPLLLFGWLWFLGTLIPVIGLIQAGSQAMADRYTYIPSLGLLLVIVLISKDVILKVSESKMVLPCFVIGASCLLIIKTEHQIWFWKDTCELFQQAVDLDPSDHITQSNLGRAYENLGKKDLAIKHYQAAIWANRNSSFPYVNLGERLLADNKPEHSIPFFQHALRSQEQAHHLAHYGLAKAYSRTHRPGDAIFHLNRSLLLKPAFAEARILLATIHIASTESTLRNAAEAIRHLKQLTLPSSELKLRVLDLLSTAYAQDGRFQEAEKTLREALEAARMEKNVVMETQLLRRMSLYRIGKLDNTK